MYSPFLEYISTYHTTRAYSLQNSATLCNFLNTQERTNRERERKREKERERGRAKEREEEHESEQERERE